MTAMRHRAFRVLVVALLALQIAIAPGVSTAAMVMVQDMSDCDGMHSAPDAGTECPCCPDGATDMGACVAACAVQAMTNGDGPVIELGLRLATPGQEPEPLGSLPHLPLVPPPIG
jgi:hypothetical protein